MKDTTLETIAILQAAVPEKANAGLSEMASTLRDQRDQLADALKDASDFIVSVKGDKHRAPFRLIEKISDALRAAGRL